MLVLATGCVIGLLFFARPTTSDAEKRQLTPFPAFTVESFLDGSFFTDVSLWYADTYPLREPMVAASQSMHKLYGIADDRAVVGGNVQADEIPVEEEVEVVKPPVSSELPNEREVAAAVQDSIMDGLYIKDGTAYSIYYFSKSGADTYLSAANELARQLDGKAHIYSLLVPSSAVVLPQEEYDSVGGSDQRQVFDYVWARFDDGVTHVDLLDTMKEHADDYPFFRTDHHWTMRGAYYGYVEFCKAKGIEPASLDSFKYRNFGDFTGTYYGSIIMFGDANIDEFETFTPSATNDMVSRDPDGTEEPDLIVADASDWGSYGKYDALSGCDPASGYIHNPEINDGSTCLVVKDSYGCAFIPYLVANYEYVHMIDPRYYIGNIYDYVEEHEIQDVILVYGIKVGLADQYASILYASVANS